MNSKKQLKICPYKADQGPVNKIRAVSVYQGGI